MNHALFEFLHHGLAHPWLDAILPVYREKTTWIPLYLLMAFLIWRKYGWRPTLWLLLALGITIGVADQLAAGVLKPWIASPRPCADPLLRVEVRELVRCGGRWGFPSNHAVNHFVVATFLSLTWLRHGRWYGRWLLFGWAASIGLAQVYVGKHYPADVLFGAGLGTLLAMVGVWIYRKSLPRTAI